MCVAVVLFIIIIFLSTFISHTKFAYAIRIAAIASEKRMNHNKKKMQPAPQMQTVYNM